VPAQAERVRCRDRPAYRGERNAAHAESAVTDYFSLSLSAASAQNLSVNGLEKSEAYLLSTYRSACEKGINGIHGTNCVFKFPDAVLAVFVGRGAQPDPLRPHKEWLLLPMVNFNIRPLGGIDNKEVKQQFLLLARQTILSKDGRTLASKFATPQSLVDFCKNSPDAVKTDGDCDLDEIRRPGVKEGLQIDVVRQVGPDANNFTSLFSVRVVKRD
jgi:hypothetical protein